MSQTPAALALAPFGDLEVPRVNRTKRHNLMDILFIALCTVVSGVNDCVAMDKFGKNKQAWLEKYLSLPHGTPSHDTFSRPSDAGSGEGQESPSCGQRLGHGESLVLGPGGR